MQDSSKEIELFMTKRKQEHRIRRGIKLKTIRHLLAAGLPSNVVIQGSSLQR